MSEVINPELKRMRAELAKKQMLQFAMIKEKAGKNLYLFNKYVLQAEKGDDHFTKLAPFHKDLCNFVQDRFDKKKLILIPRSHLKTKLVSIGYSTFKIMQNPKIRILIYSATWQMAVDIHRSIQKNLKNERVMAMWGDIALNATEWTQDRTRLASNDKREATITAAGIDNNLVGGHYDLIIFDDPVSRDNVGTMDQIAKVITRYRDSLDLLEPHGELILMGTRWHDSDLYGWVLDPENKIRSNYLVMIKSAFAGNIMTGEDFEPLWSGKYNLKNLRSILQEEGWAHFSSQYCNDPVPEENATFKRPWFRYYISDDLRGKIMNKFLVIDPAISLTKDADYTAMVVIGVDEWNNVFILDITRQKLSPNQIISEIIRLNNVWRVQDVGIEEIAFQKVISYSLRDDPRFKKQPFHITALKPQERNKDQRIKALQPLYENGKVFHNKTLANNIYLEDELIRFPRSTHDDIIDALAYSLDIIFPAHQPAQRRMKRSRYLYS